MKKKKSNKVREFMHWWFEGLSEDNQAVFIACIILLGLIILLLIFGWLHAWFYPIICLVDIIVGVLGPAIWAVWYFSKKYKEWSENDDG